MQAVDKALEHQVLTEVWESYDDEEYRRDQSHWRGVGRWADDAVWQGIGRRTLHNLNLAAALANQIPVDVRTEQVALEWGPGGGANMFSFRNVVRSYYGIDISASNLAEADRMIRTEGYDIYRPVLVSDNVSEVAKAVPEPVDIFLSTAVFQHFPNKAYGEEVLRAIRACCRIGAIGSIQIRFDNDNPRYKGEISIEEYKARHIFANSYRLDEFWNLCRDVGLPPLAIPALSTTNNYATFLLKAV